MRLDTAKLSHTNLPNGRTVKVDFNWLSPNPGKVLKEAHEFEFIIRVIKAQSQFWDQVVSIDQKGHV
jgi:hypothetical protein